MTLARSHPVTTDRASSVTAGDSERPPGVIPDSLAVAAVLVENRVMRPTEAVEVASLKLEIRQVTAEISSEILMDESRRADESHLLHEPVTRDCYDECVTGRRRP